MPLFTSVVRQYTPPTCTLEVKARESPLSRWVPLKALNQLSFELRFDDPRQPQEKQVIIWGDRAELESLYEAVTSYVQDLVDQSATQMPVELWEPATTPLTREVTPDEGNSHHSKALPGSRLNSFNPAADDQQSEELEQEYASVARPLMPLSASPYLQQKSLVAHDLVLGPLETDDSGPVVTLSVTQLFDLATALDEYATDIVALPNLTQPRRLQSVPVWTYVAAGVVVAGVGLTLAVGQMISRSNTKPKVVAVVPSPESSTTDSTLIDPNVAPVPTPLEPTPLGQISPTPTPLGQTQPTPIPLGQEPLSVSPLVPTQPPLPPPASIQQPTRSFSFPSNPRGNQTPSGSSTIAPTSPRSSSKLPIFTTQPLEQPRFDMPAEKTAPPAPRATRQQSRVERTAKKTAPPAASTPPRSPQKSRSRDLSDVPSVSASPPSPPIGTDSESVTQTLPSQQAPAITVPPIVATNTPAVQERREADADNNADNNDLATSRLFDTIPQVQEARDKLQKQWKPPQGLTQSLQYTLVVNEDGSIQRIITLGEAAKKYMDSTGIPRLGEPFLAPLQGKRKANIRVDLKSDGNVETFLVP